VEEGRYIPVMTCLPGNAYPVMPYCHKFECSHRLRAHVLSSSLHSVFAAEQHSFEPLLCVPADIER
jgi:hypothetical protein